MSANVETFDGNIIKYDIDNLRKYYKYLKECEEVYITEKIHGASSRFVYRDDRLWCSSRNQFIKPEENNLWWKLGVKYDLESKLKKIPEIAVYGEAYGYVQDLKYGVEKGEVKLALFDILDTVNMEWLDVDSFLNMTDSLDLPIVPEIYRGPLPDKETLFAMAEGKSLVEGADHIREGIVVKPMKERLDYRFNRIIFKLPGEAYLLRKQK